MRQQKAASQSKRALHFLDGLSLSDSAQTAQLLPACSCWMYNQLLFVYVRKRQVDEAFAVADAMRAKGLAPDKFTYAGLLAACAKVWQTLSIYITSSASCNYQQSFQHSISCLRGRIRRTLCQRSLRKKQPASSNRC